MANFSTLFPITTNKIEIEEFQKTPAIWVECGNRFWLTFVLLNSQSSTITG